MSIAEISIDIIKIPEHSANIQERANNSRGQPEHYGYKECESSEAYEDP